MLFCVYVRVHVCVCVCVAYARGRKKKSNDQRYISNINSDHKYPTFDERSDDRTTGKNYDSTIDRRRLTKRNETIKGTDGRTDGHSNIYPIPSLHQLHFTSTLHIHPQGRKEKREKRNKIILPSGIGLWIVLRIGL